MFGTRWPPCACRSRRRTDRDHHRAALRQSEQKDSNMDISVIGAGGAIGRETVAQRVAGRVLKPTERL